MKRILKYILLIIVIASAVLYYISYKTSIPVTELVKQAPDLISSLQSADIDAEFVEKYASGNQKILNVLHYDLNLELFPEDKKIKGIAALKMETKGLKNIDLNFYDSFDIKSVKLDGVPVKYENKDTRFTITPSGQIRDTSLVEIIYEGKPKSMGFGSFTFGEKNGKSFIYTMSEPVFASTWFPCNDIPSDKAQFDIRITNDSSKVSVSNGKLVDVTSKGARRTYHWQTAYPMATYLAAVYSADYVKISDEYTSPAKTKMPVVYYVTAEKEEGAKRDFDIHTEAIGIFSRLFGEYPFIKEKYGVAEFLWNKGALENQTITGLGSDFISGMSLQKDLLVHELAHSWWGNAVSPADWKDVWLNEGFATYSTALYYEALTDKRALFSTMRTYFGEFKKGTLYNPEADLFSRLIYNKGAWVLHMLRKEIGDEAFFKMVKKYFAEYKYKNASTEDLKKVCESVSGKNLTQFFKQWVYEGTGIINADYSFTSEKQQDGGYIVKIRLEQTQSGYSAYRFPIDIQFTAPDGNSITKSFYISQKEAFFEANLSFSPQSVTPDPEGWLLAKLNKK